jgi:hypothetical protein
VKLIRCGACGLERPGLMNWQGSIRDFSSDDQRQIAAVP